jgi:4-hydroxybutyrate dehydrogenase
MALIAQAFAIALDGLARAVAWLGRAVEDGSNAEARRQMMMAALQGGLTFQKGLGAVHALSHPLGGLSKTPLHHGTLNSILLPAVLRFNEPFAEEKYVRIRHALGLENSADLSAFSAGFAAGPGLPDRLGAVGVDKALLRDVAAAAGRDHSHATNPGEASEADCLGLLEEAF